MLPFAMPRTKRDGGQRTADRTKPLLLSLVFCLLSAVLCPLSSGCTRPSAANPPPATTAGDPRAGTPAPQAIPVKVVRPKRDPSLVLSVQQPAYVQAFYQADLLARAAGPVKYLVKDIGQTVKQG